MSGPITALVFVIPAAALLAAAGIRAAVAVAEGYQQAEDLRQRQQQQREQQQADQAAATQTGQQAADAARQAVQAESAELMRLAERLGLADTLRASQPALPDSTDSMVATHHLTALQRWCAESRRILLTEAGRRLQDLPEEAAGLTGTGPLPPSQATAQRLLARLAHLDTIPETITALARELDQTLPGERADLLASELRSRIQAHLHAVQQAELQQATATIVEQSLKDLGYQVEGVSHTLFVTGGVAHFRRPGWGNYQVRMRIDAAANTAHFNVVRAVTAADNERSVLDHLAEDRWCAEFPALLKALADQGVQLQVTRRLAAGELPVQLVDAAKLPQFPADEEQRASAPPLTRSL